MPVTPVEGVHLPLEPFPTKIGLIISIDNSKEGQRYGFSNSIL